MEVRVIRLSTTSPVTIEVDCQGDAEAKITLLATKINGHFGVVVASEVPIKIDDTGESR